MEHVKKDRMETLQMTPMLSENFMDKERQPFGEIQKIILRSEYKEQWRIGQHHSSYMPSIWKLIKKRPVDTAHFC